MLRIPIIPLPRGQSLIAFAMVAVVKGGAAFCHQRFPRSGAIIIVEFNNISSRSPCYR